MSATTWVNTVHLVQAGRLDIKGIHLNEITEVFSNHIYHRSESWPAIKIKRCCASVAAVFRILICTIIQQRCNRGEMVERNSQGYVNKIRSEF